MLLILCLTIFFSISAVSAADTFVNATLTTGTHTGESWENAFNTIQDGYNGVTNGNTINIAAGNYIGAANKNININKDITIQGAGKDNTIIDCENSGRAFTVNSGKTVTFNNLTIKNGNEIIGAAITNNGGTVTASGIKFKDNTATATTYGNGGGAIYNYNYGMVTVIDCTFNGNQARDGGAIYNYQGTITVTNSNFTGNNATSVDGGAIENLNGNLYLTNCIFSQNTAPNSGGGAIDNMANCTVTGCTFTNNNAQYAGAFYNNGGTATITGTTFTGNTANMGGAIYNSNTIIANFNRIVGNTASTSGNAIYNAYGSVNAEYNWWGTNSDPTTISNLLTGSVDAHPWLLLSIKADPTEIYNTKTSKVTADLFTDSESADHSGDSAKYPAEIPLTFTATWGSISQALLDHGTGFTTFTANGGALPALNPVTVNAADTANPTATVSTTITIKSTADLYVKVTSSNNKPKVGETITITYKLGNHGPDAAKNVTITIPLPEGFEVSKITGNGQWTYDKATNSITWTLVDVPVGDPYLHVSGMFTEDGSYVFDGSIASETFNLNTEGVIPLTVNVQAAENNDTDVNADTETIGMQNTGLPLAYLVIAILFVLGGLVMPKKK